MVSEIIESQTEWIDTEDGKRLKWVCPECDSEYLKERRHATIRCRECDRTMQSANYDASQQGPDPNNPERVLRSIAERRGFPSDYYLPDDDEPEPENPLEW